MKAQLKLPCYALFVACLLYSFSACQDTPDSGTPSGNEEPVVEKRQDILLDAHSHLASQRLIDALGGGSTQYVPPTTAQVLVDSFLDVSGSQQALLLSSGYMWSSNTLVDSNDTGYIASPEQYANVRYENDYTVEQAALYPDRLIPLCGVHPVKDYAIPEIDRCIDSLGVQGLKMQWSNSNVNLREPNQLEAVKAVIQHAAERNLPVVLHFANIGMDDFGREDMAIMIEEVLTQAPGLRLSFAHLTGAGDFPESTQETLSLLIEAYQNNTALQQVELFTDVSAVFTDNVDQTALDTMAVQLRAFGLDRVFWGSDNNDDYVGPTQSMWPLDNAAYNRMASHGPQRLLEEKPTAQ